MKQPAKPLFKSRTVRVGTAYITVGALVAILQLFDLLKLIFEAVDLNQLSPQVATWGGILLAVIGAVQVWLRTITTQPIGEPQTDDEDLRPPDNM